LVRALHSFGYLPSESLSSASQLTYFLRILGERDLFDLISAARPFGRVLCNSTRVSDRDTDYRATHSAGSFGEPVDEWYLTLLNGRLYVSGPNHEAYTQSAALKSVRAPRRLSQLRELWEAVPPAPVALLGVTHERSVFFLNQAHRDLGAAFHLCEVGYSSQAGHSVQQAVEKCLKAILFHLGARAEKIHPLEELVDSVRNAQLTVGARLATRYDTVMKRITPFAVKYRYEPLDPEFSPDDLWHYLDLAIDVHSAAWHIIQSHQCRREVSTAAVVSSWDEPHIRCLARRHAGAIGWATPSRPKRILLDWLTAFRHDGSQPGVTCTCPTRPSWPPVPYETPGSEPLAYWWLIPGGGVLGVERAGGRIRRPSHYRIQPGKSASDAKLRQLSQSLNISDQVWSGGR
jgi:HEPN domain-containing protein